MDLKTYALPLVGLAALLLISGLFSVGVVPQHGEDYRALVCAYEPVASADSGIVAQLKTVPYGSPTVDAYYQRVVMFKENPSLISSTATDPTACWNPSTGYFENKDSCAYGRVSYAQVYADYWTAGKTISGVSEFTTCGSGGTTDAYCKAIDANSELKANGACDCVAGFDQVGGKCVTAGSGNVCINADGICPAGCGAADSDCVGTPAASSTPSATPSGGGGVPITPTVTPSATASTGAGGTPLAGVSAEQAAIAGIIVVGAAGYFAARKYGVL